MWVGYVGTSGTGVEVRCRLLYHQHRPCPSCNVVPSTNQQDYRPPHVADCLGAYVRSCNHTAGGTKARGKDNQGQRDPGDTTANKWQNPWKWCASPMCNTWQSGTPGPLLHFPHQWWRAPSKGHPRTTVERGPTGHGCICEGQNWQSARKMGRKSGITTYKAICFSIFDNVSMLKGFGMISSAPQLRHWSRVTSSVLAVTSTTGVEGCSCFKILVASTPPITGISTSIRITSKDCSRAASIACKSASA